MLVIALVAIGYRPPQQASSVVASAVNQGDVSLQPSVDQVVETTVAADIAARAHLPVAANLANMSVSLAAEGQLDQTNSNVISKPQIVQPSTDNRSITTYKTKSGDTVDSVAKHFNISSNTVRWVNNLESDALTPGQKLRILSTDGIVHVVKSGDTVGSLAKKYHANKEIIIAYNDLETKTKLKTGHQLVIPGGVLPTKERPGYEAIDETAGGSGYGYGYGYSGVNAGLAGASAGNRYAFGNCTWYAFNRRAELGKPIGSYWGNAATWAAYARVAGYAVNGTPAAGAVMQNSGGYGGFGHVSVVERVVPGKYVRISEMNAYRAGGGFNRVDFYNVPWSDAMSGVYSYIH